MKQNGKQYQICGSKSTIKQTPGSRTKKQQLLTCSMHEEVPGSASVRVKTSESSHQDSQV